MFIELSSIKFNCYAARRSAYLYINSFSLLNHLPEVTTPHWPIWSTQVISLFTWCTHFGIIITYNHPLQQVPIITIMPLITNNKSRYSCSWSVEKSALVDDIRLVWPKTNWPSQPACTLVTAENSIESQLIQMCNWIFKLTFFRSTDCTVNQVEIKTEASCRQMDGRIIKLLYSSLSWAFLRLLHCNRHACVLTINKTWYFGGFETSICSNSKARGVVRAKEW